MSNVNYISDDTFEAEVLKSDKPVLVDFTASWCGPCKGLAPILDDIAENRDDIKIVKIDVGGNKETKEETNPETRDKYDIRVFPTLCLFRGDKIADVKLGGGDKKSLESWIDKTLEQNISNDLDLEGYKEKVQKQREEAEKKMNRFIAGIMVFGGLWKTGKIGSGLTSMIAGALTASPITFGLGAVTTTTSAIDIHDTIQLGKEEKQIRPRLKGIFKDAYNYAEGAAYMANGFILTNMADNAASKAAEIGLDTVGTISIIAGTWGLGTKLLSHLFKKEAKAEGKKAETETSSDQNDGLICEDGACRLPTEDDRASEHNQTLQP